MPTITTTAFIFHRDKVLFVYHKRLKRWMHVGGHVEEDEFFDEALKREIKEEVNLDVSIVDHAGLELSSPEHGIVRQSNPFFVHGSVSRAGRNIALDYICVAKEPVKVKLFKSELSDFRWLTKEELEAIETFPLLRELALKAFEIYKKQ